MKPIISLGLFFLLPIMAFSQQIAVENQKANEILVAMDHPLSIVVEGIPCGDIIVNIDNGKLEKEEDSDCNYILHPETIGTATLSIYKFSAEEVVLIGKRVYEVIPFPQQKAQFCSASSEVTIGEFLTCEGLRLPILNMDIGGDLTIKSFTIEVSRKGKIWQELPNDGGKFEEENLEQLRKIKVGDQIRFKHIYGIFHGDDAPRALDDLRLEIVK